MDNQINIHRSEVHCGSAFEPGSSGLPFYCTPPLCVPAVLGALAVWRLSTKKPKKKLGKEFKSIPNKYGHICPGLFLTPSPTSPRYANLTFSKIDLRYYSQSHLGWHFRKLFQSSKLKARTSLFTETLQKRRSSFELWALKQHSKMSPQLGSAVNEVRTSKVRVLTFGLSRWRAPD